MKRFPWGLAAIAFAAFHVSASATTLPPAPAEHPAATEDQGLRRVIRRHLGRPYVWGASGLKSFDCSGFVWRVMSENGVRIKRTTARKFYYSLPRVSEEERWSFGNIVFFDHLTHCGIVDTRESFYHAAVSRGTHATEFDPFWRRKISGVRAMPGLPRPESRMISAPLSPTP